MSYEEDQIDRLYDEVIYLRKDNERLARHLNVVHHELKAWKEHTHRIMDIKADALLTQSMQPWIMVRMITRDLLKETNAGLGNPLHTKPSMDERDPWELFANALNQRLGSSAAEVAAKGKDKEA